MKKIYSIGLLVLTFCFGIDAYGQLLPPNQPEQDACDALLLCGNSFTTPYSYQGIGLVSDLTSTPCSGGEGNSMWIRLNVSTAGTIVFTIAPISPDDDYDMAVVDMTGTNCSSLSSANVIRCNFNNNNPGSNINGIIGLNSTSTMTTVGSGSFGNSFCQQVTANAGDVYLIMINNFGNYVTGGPSQGFTIDFTGSTATFAGQNPPLYDSLSAVPCNAVSTITAYMNTSILCSSIASDGSDFQIIPALATVTGATGFNCSGANGYTNEIQLTFSNPLPGGSYTIMPAVGTDGNTLMDLCTTQQPLTDTISFNVTGPLVDLGPDTITCTGDSLQLHAVVGGSGISGTQYAWSPATFLNSTGILDPICAPTQDIDYIFTVTPIDRPECADRDTLHISVLQGFDLLNEDTTICIGGSVSMNISGDNRYHYTWTPALGLSDSMVSNPVASPASSTLYTLTGAYPGCSDTSQSVLIIVDTSVPSYFYFTMDKDRICSGETVHFIPYIDAGLTQFAWDFGDGSSIMAPLAAAQHAYDHPGVMPVTITASFLACPDTTYRDTVYVFAYPFVNLGPDSVLCLDGQAIMLANQADNPPGDYRYLWSTGDTVSALRVVHPGQYSLKVSGANDCATTEAVTINKDCYIDIPNAFTPDGDGLNDYFFPRQLLSKSLNGFRMQIFNRWGQLIFETVKNNGRGWDGAFNGKAQPAGVYIYLIDVNIEGNRREQYRGNVTLVR